jgi:hypothetical protein
MSGISDLQRDVIVRLRLDPTQMKEGAAQAKQILANARTEALALKAEEIRTRGELESRFTAQYVRELRSQLSATTQMSAEKRAALTGEIADYAALTEKVRTLRLGIMQAQATGKEAQIASSAFRQQGGGGGWEQYGNERVLSGFTLGGAAQAVGLGSLTMGIPMALSAIASGFKDAAFGATEFAHSLDIISQKTGVPSRDLQVLGAIGKTVGLSLDDMVIATRMFSKAMVGGDGGVDGFEGVNTRGSKALAALGIATRDAQGNMRSMNAVMDDVAEKFKAAPDGAEKAAIAVTLFGRSGLNLIPYLNLGKEGLNELRSAFGMYSTDLTTAAKAQEQWEVATAKFSLAVNGLKSNLSGLVEVLAACVENMVAFYGATLRVDNEMQGYAKATGLKGTLTPAGVDLMQAIVGNQSTDVLGRKSLPAQQALATGKASLESKGMMNSTDIQQAMEFIGMKNGQLQIEGRINELLIQEKTTTKETTEEMKRAALIASGAREEMEKKLIAAREALELARQEADARVEEARRKAELPPGAFAFTQITKVQGEVAGAEITGKNLSGDALIKNLEEQKRLTAELAQLEAARQASIAAHANAVEQAARIKDLQDQAKIIDDMLRKSQQTPDGIVNQILYGPSRGPTASLGHQPVEFFTEPIAKLNAQEGAGVVPVQQQIDARRALIAALEDEITARAANKNMSDAEIETLAKLNTLLKEQKTALKDLEKATPAAELLGYFKELGDIIGKFSPGLNKIFSEIAASNEVLMKSLEALRTLGTVGTKKGSVLDGIKDITSNDSVKRATAISNTLGAIAGIAGTIGAISQSTGTLSGMFTGAMGGAMIGTEIMPGIGTAVGAIGGAVFGGLTGAKRSQGAALVKQIKDSMKEITNAYNDGTTSLADTITQYQALRDKAVASIRGGKKGNSTEMQQYIDALDSQIASLKKQQKSVLDAFNQQIGIFALPTGAQDIASKIVAIAKAIKEAGDAGATAAEQIAYLNEAMDALKTTTAQGLRTDEQDTLNLMMQELDVKKQITDLNTSYNDSVLDVKRSLGLAAALTPEQQAAKQLKDLKKQHDDQLASLTAQQSDLQAQLDGRMELFGWTQKDLNATTARAAILDQQLTIERSITAETIARITAQEAYLAQMASGKIPALPAGTLPPGFSFPTGTGSQYNTFSPGSVVIQVSGKVTAQEMADKFQEMLRIVNKGQQVGLQ